MYLKYGTLNGKKYLSIAHNYRNPETKKVRAKIVKALGYLEELEKEYPNPIAHFKQVVAEMNEQTAAQKELYKITLNPNCKVSTDNRKNIGYSTPVGKST